MTTRLSASLLPSLLPPPHTSKSRDTDFNDNLAQPTEQKNDEKLHQTHCISLLCAQDKVHRPVSRKNFSTRIRRRQKEATQP